MAERGSTEFCTDADGSGRCKSDTETASPRQTRAASCTYSRSRSGLDAAEGCCEPTLSSDVQPLCLATHPGRSHLLAAAFAACDRTPCSSRECGESSEHGHCMWSSRCLVPGHDGWGHWGKVLARLTALLIKKLLYNLQGASAVRIFPIMSGGLTFTLFLCCVCFILFAFIMGDPLFAYYLVLLFPPPRAAVLPVPGRLRPCLFVGSFQRSELASPWRGQLGAGRTTKGSKETLFKRPGRKAGGQ